MPLLLYLSFIALPSFLFFLFLSLLLLICLSLFFSLSLIISLTLSFTLFLSLLYHIWVREHWSGRTHILKRKKSPVECCAYCAWNCKLLTSHTFSRAQPINKLQFMRSKSLWGEFILDWPVLFTRFVTCPKVTEIPLRVKVLPLFLITYY